MTLRANLVTVKMPTDTYHHGNLRQALIDEATRTLEREGAEAISFRGLARNLGVSHAAPGHHFADRHELLAELAADGYAALADAMTAAMAGVEPEEWLGRTGQAYVRFGIANPKLYRMMFASQLMTEECPERLLIESSRAYMLLLRASHRSDLVADPMTYRMETPELAAWSIVHGAVMLFLDGQLGPMMDGDGFLALADVMLARFAG